MSQKQTEIVEAILNAETTSVTPGIGKGIPSIISREIVAQVSNDQTNDPSIELRIDQISAGYLVHLTVGGGLPHPTFRSEALQPTREAAISKAWKLFQKRLLPNGFRVIDVNPDTLPDDVGMLKRIVAAVQTQSTKRARYVDTVIGNY